MFWTIKKALFLGLYKDLAIYQLPKIMVRTTKDGINGSPSCGIDYTCDADWGGYLEKIPSVEIERPGVFMDEFEKMLQEQKVNIRFYDFREFTL